MKEVTLTQILNAREERVLLQKKLIADFKKPIISFTMNIAGSVKTTPLIERAFFTGISFLKKELNEKIISEHIKTPDTGCLAIFSVDEKPDILKNICIKIEESLPIGRLFDMDVIDTDGNKLSRKTERSCIVCGKRGRTCSAGRVHSAETVFNTSVKIITDYFLASDFEKIADLAVQSLKDEVYTTPKPGLVDKVNNGSHNDMTVDTFLKSADSLKPFFVKFLMAGHDSSDKSADDTFSLLKSTGIEAEKTMYNVTKGVNTHKGAIYSLGVILGSIGKLWTSEKTFYDLTQILSLCSEIVKSAAEADFTAQNENTAGMKLYIKYGLMGIRGEALKGFPCVKNISLPTYQKLLKNGLNQNDAGAVTLLYLIANAEDTNLYKRGGIKGAEFAKKSAIELISNNFPPSKKQISELDKEFISRSLSPGGSADLLAVTYFLHSLIINYKETDYEKI